MFSYTGLPPCMQMKTTWQEYKGKNSVGTEPESWWTIAFVAHSKGWWDRNVICVIWIQPSKVSPMSLQTSGLQGAGDGSDPTARCIYIVGDFFWHLVQTEKSWSKQRISELLLNLWYFFIALLYFTELSWHHVQLWHTCGHPLLFQLNYGQFCNPAVEC